MDYIIEISKIIEGALKLDNSKVKSYSKLLIEKLSANDDYVAAKKISKIIESSIGGELQGMSVSDFNKTPVDPESRVPVADVVTCFDKNEDTILTDLCREEINTFILSYKKSEKLSNMGIEVSNRLLMYGPPGCGKTNSAYYIAKEVGLPLVIARMDSIISSYLGNTAKNIRSLFDYVEKMPCVLFLDEFDAVAKARDDNNELGELKRVVNSLLQNIDSMNSNCILIAATNHHEMLDDAIWRRFNYKINIGLPDFEGRKKLINMVCPQNLLDDKEVGLLSIAFEGLSGSDIHQLIRKALTKSVIYEYKISMQSIFEEYFLMKNIYNTNQADKELLSSKANYLRSLDEKAFSYIILANILGVSKTQISTLLKK